MAVKIKLQDVSKPGFKVPRGQIGAGLNPEK
jgi:hypothetical protein